mmetsp:Transcript_145/g.228  ORF Transcript_145/g.228 Transcript_145/m.228 type:complete len:197 (+) Transcript_145:167-757(+)
MKISNIRYVVAFLAVLPTVVANGVCYDQGSLQYIAICGNNDDYSKVCYNNPDGGSIPDQGTCFSCTGAYEYDCSSCQCKLSSDAIAGIVVGVIFVVAVIIIVCCVCCCGAAAFSKRKRRTAMAHGVRDPSQVVVIPVVPGTQGTNHIAKAEPVNPPPQAREEERKSDNYTTDSVDSEQKNSAVEVTLGDRPQHQAA